MEIPKYFDVSERVACNTYDFLVSKKTGQSSCISKGQPVLFLIDRKAIPMMEDIAVASVQAPNQKQLGLPSVTCGILKSWLIKACKYREQHP